MITNSADMRAPGSDRIAVATRSKTFRLFYDHHEPRSESRLPASERAVRLVISTVCWTVDQPVIAFVGVDHTLVTARLFIA